MAKNQILIIGVVGAGAYLAWEYWQYSNLPAATQAALPFWNYLLSNWGIGATTATSTATTPAATTTPQAVQAAPPAPVTSGTPAPPAAPTSALQQLQQTAGQGTYITTSTGAVALAPVRAVPIPPPRGTTPLLPNRGATQIRPSSPISPSTSLSIAPGSRSGRLGGFGAVRVLPGGPPINTAGNLLYQAHHPLPYIPGYHMRGMRGLGGVTQATGLEKVLFARRPLRSNRIG